MILIFNNTYRSFEKIVYIYITGANTGILALGRSWVYEGFALIIPYSKPLPMCQPSYIHIYIL
jgi:hypothetical protein